MSRVLLEHVTKRFDQTLAVSDFNLEVRDQEFVVLVGPSGCGKSTTLRMVAGLEEITEGNVFIGDRLVNDLPPKERNIAMVFQNYALYPHMDVYTNLAFALKRRKFPKEEIDRRVTEAARILGIEGLLDRKPKHLSGGQRQRVAVGRAIVRKPEVFLFDEPLSNLDAKLRLHMRMEITKLHNRLGATMIYVTHDQVEAMTMGDRIVVMKEGRIQQVGTPMEIYDTPSNLFVAGFVGSPSMNLMESRIVRRDGALYIDTAGFEARIPESRSAQCEGLVNREVIFGIRPEHIQDRMYFPEAVEENCFTAHVDFVEPMGSEMIVYFHIGEVSMVGKLTPKTSARHGSDLDIHIDMDRIHIFDKETGRIIQ
ncbi:MAG: sn-glycerol-3-phosphate ABC transporter ATP-binding protein UgpC [Deltaproteobacteria bacterium]|nr:sn-glycerol-3-phosphate ABC transporter ATP-binding protein UgpC [Deltaproteobacteria bacterium]